MEELNCKGQLITYCANRNLQLQFHPTLQNGLPHDPMFTSRVYVNNELLGEDHGKKKKEAENKAARMALTTLQNREHQVLPPAPQNSRDHQESNTREAELQEAANGSAQGPQDQPNYVGIFNQFCQKKGWGGAGFNDTGRRGPSHVQEFFLRATNGIHYFPEARGKSKKQARHKAAFLALLELKRKYSQDILLQSILPGSYTDKSGSETPESTNDVQLDSRDLVNGDTGTADTDFKVSFRSSTGGIPSTPKMPENPLKDFDNIEKLDKGGFGNVFKARKKLDNKFYAVKKVALTKRNTLLEVQALAIMDHPNIVRYYNSWTAEDSSEFSSTSSSSSEIGSSTIVLCLFIQMELCEDGNLKEWIERMQTVEKSKSLDVFHQIVEGVIYIHSNNLIHRDLKPANILFAKKKVKIGDFGLVTQIKGECEIQALQRTQGTGTPMYMAPEQTGCSYGNEVDIFPLGLILFQLLCIFKTFHEIWPNLRKNQLPETFVKQYPFEEAIIRKMLSKDPKKRPTAIKLKELIDVKYTFDTKTC